MTEEDIKLQYITPAITAKWSQSKITMETKVTDGRINLKGNVAVREKPKNGDYTLAVPVNDYLVDNGLAAGSHYTFSLKVGKDVVAISSVTVEGWVEMEIDGGVAEEEVLPASTEAELVAALEKGGNIMLTGDITVSDEYPFGYDITGFVNKSV